MDSNKFSSDQAGIKSKKIKCQYYVDDDGRYTCDVQDAQEIPPDANIEFVGAHEFGKHDNDVKAIKFYETFASKLPSVPTTKFPNLEALYFSYSDLKDITRKDLYEYRNLKHFIFSSNEFDYLPGDLFADCKNLEEIDFNNNQLTTIEPNILDGLKHLKYVNFGVIYGEIRSETAFKKNDLQFLKMNNKLYQDYVKKMSKHHQQMVKFQSFLQLEETMKDLHIYVDNMQFPVHKIFLAFRSPFLAEIIRNNPDAEYLRLEDISAVIFEKILKYIYTNEFLCDVDFIELFEAAEHLKIEELKEYASGEIMKQMDHENALDILSLGNKYGHEEMKRKAFKKIKQKYGKMKLKDELLNEAENLEQVIKHLQKIRDIEKDIEDFSGHNK